MNTKPLPIIVTLVACLISCVVSIFEGVGFRIFVIRFALTALIFYVVFSFVRVFLDIGLKVDKEETEKQEIEGRDADVETEGTEAETEPSEEEAVS